MRSTPKVTTPPSEPERAAVQQLVCRRLALRFGMSAAVASTVATLAGLGPEAAWRASR